MSKQNIIGKNHVVTGLAPILPNSSTPDYVSLKNHSKFTAIIVCDNNTTVTGSAITLKQATAVAGTSEKALAFSWVYQNEDTAASDVLVKTAVTSDTFTTDDTNAKNLIYVIEADVADLDVSGGFDCVRVGAGDAVASIVSITYILGGSRYNHDVSVTAITD
jgi:hypothetical protein